MTPAISAGRQNLPDRKPRCLRLVEHSNGIRLRSTAQCPNERLPGSALCAHHLGEVAGEYAAIIAEAKARHPSAGPHPSATPVADLCRRCGRPPSPAHDPADCDARPGDDAR